MIPPGPFNSPAGNPTLKITIYSELDGRTTELLFSEYPVRVGRNRQNDLVLRHEYVSQYHAEIHFTGGVLSVVQVGSSNSVRVDGRKLRPQENLPLRGQEEIRVVPFTLRATMQPVQAPAPRAASVRSDTVMPVEDPMRPDMPPLDLPSGGWAPSAPPVQPIVAAPPVQPIVAAPPVQPIVAAPPAPPPVSLPTWDPAQPTVPEPGWEQAPPPMPVPGIPSPEAGQAALAVLDRLAQRYLGRSLAGAQEVAAVGILLEQALDIFLRFFVAMQRGQVQFYNQMGVPPPADQLNAAEQCTSAVQLGGVLFNPAEANGAWALEGAFESLKVHQVAVLRGVEAGVRSLLRRIGPDSVAKVAGRLTRSPGVRTLWETYRQMHEDLAEEDMEAFKVIYGGQFRKAYLRLMQQGREANRG